MGWVCGNSCDDVSALDMDGKRDGSFVFIRRTKSRLGEDLVLRMTKNNNSKGH